MFLVFSELFNAKLWNIYKLCVLQELIQKGETSSKKEEKKTAIAAVSVVTEFDVSRQRSKQMAREQCHNNILCVATQDLKLADELCCNKRQHVAIGNEKKPV